MKLASISVVLGALLLSFAMGCSSGRTSHPTDTGVHPPMDAGRVVVPDTGPPTDTGSVGPRDTGTLPRDTGGTTVRDTGGGGACTITCTSDSMCASSCGAVPGGGIRCCDRSTSHCFVSHTATCPAAGSDSGGMSY
jgi:hypothetical protein